MHITNHHSPCTNLGKIKMDGSKNIIGQGRKDVDASFGYMVLAIAVVGYSKAARFLKAMFSKFFVPSYVGSRSYLSCSVNENEKVQHA